jgi:hypothetical protein
MPKTPSHKLFNLIKSLSGSEKRYFKLLVSGNKGEQTSKYIQLFDAIDQQEIFDDEALKTQIYEGEPILSRKYSELKAYLYDLILKSLQGYDEKSSIDFKLKGMLQSIRVLFKRAHYEDCLDLLPKIKKIAYRYESFSQVLEVIKWERQVAYALMDIKYLNDHLERFDQEENDCLAKLKNLSTYQHIFFRLLIHIRKNAVLRTDKQIDDLDSILQNDLLSDLSKATSHRASVTFLRIHALYFYSIHEYDQFHEKSKQCIELIESNKTLQREDISVYISAMSNYILSCGLLGKEKEIEYNLHKMSRLKPINLTDKLTIYKQVLGTKLRLFINRGDFDEGLKLLEQHFLERQEFKRNAFERGAFYFQYFYIYFGIGDYDKALEYLNEWLNLPRSIERQDLQSLARVLNLIIHYEMENSILLDNLLRSTYRFLKQRNRMYKLERSVLDFIRDANKAMNAKEKMATFIALKARFETLAKDPTENVLFQYFNFIAWTDSKIDKTSFAKAVKRHYDSK